MAISVFLSVGRPFTEEQERFVSHVEVMLGEQGLKPRTVGRNEFSNKSPLKLVDQLMDRCAGVLVIALERVAVERGVEKRGSENEANVVNEVFSTPWNQIEAAFAYAKGLPLFVVKDRRVRSEGLLEPRYDWYVYSTELETPLRDSREFMGTLSSWQRDVKKRAGWFGYRTN